MFAICSIVFAVTDLVVSLVPRLPRIFVDMRDTIDVFRMVASDFFIYALLVCSILKIVSEQAYKFEKTADIVEMVLFAMKTLWKVISVYLFRLIFFGYTFRNIHQERKNCEASKSGLYFLIQFYLHMVGQMVAQAVMIVAIWGKIEQENPVRGEDIHVSGFLWYMIAGGYVLPFIGIFTFTIFNYHEVQKFPIGVTLDMLSLQEFSDVCEGRLSEADHDLQEVKEILSLDFTKMNRGICTVRYSCQSPLMGILSVGYFFTLIAFVVCSINIVEDSRGGINVDRLWFFVAGMVVVSTANSAIVYIAMAWMTILVIVIGLTTLACLLLIPAAAIFVALAIIWSPLILLSLLCTCFYDALHNPTPRNSQFY